MIFKSNSKNVLSLGIIAGIIFWCLDAIIDVIFFNEDGVSIIENIFQPDTHELYMRGIVLLLFVVITLYTRSLLIKQESITKELEKHKNNLEGLVCMRTEQLEKIAATDDLTQIANRRSLYEQANNEVERSIRYKHPLSVIMIDIDFFKKINDEYGHAIGDQVLQHFTTCISHIIRKTDIFGRTGGEEFALVLPETDIKSAKELAEKIRLSVSNEKFPVVGHITISLGVSQLLDEDKLQSLFKRTDLALYAAKNEGRNCVVSS